MSLVWDNGELVDDSVIFGGVGPQSDGTYGVPTTAEQVNDPANTAGYPASSDSSALDILKWGVGIVSDTWKFGQQMDYKRWEATQGGVYQQGATANVPRVASGGISSNFIFASVAVVALVLLLTHKNG